MENSGRKGNMLLLGWTILLLFLLAESGIRLLDWHRGYGFFSDYRDQIARINPLIPYRIFGWKMYWEVDGVPHIVSTHGELFPLRKPEGTIRIVAFGGSTTKQITHDGIHYPLRLQQMLQKRYPEKRIEVINAGEYAYATTHMITLLALDVISWEPDFVILSENANDLTAAYFDRNYTPDYSNKYESPSYMPPYQKRYTALNVLLRKSNFYWFLRGKIDILTRSIDSSENETRRASYGDEPPLSAQNLFHRNLNTFVAIAQKQRIPVLFASQPFNARYDHELWDFIIDNKGHDNAAYPLLAELATHHKKFNEIIRRAAKDSGSYFLDNDALFANDQSLFIDSFHYTKKGIETLAENYYRFFIDNKLIDAKG